MGEANFYYFTCLKYIFNLRKYIKEERWVAGRRGAIGTARTNRTPNQDFAGVCPILRFVFTTWVVRRRASTSFLSASTWSPTSMNSSPLRLWKLLAFAPTSTWSSSWAKTLSTCVSASILSTSSASTKCYRAPELIGSRPEWEELLASPKDWSRV